MSTTNPNRSGDAMTRGIGAIACAVFEDEVKAFLSRAEVVKQFELLPQGLHNTPPELRKQLQLCVDRLEANPQIDSIVLVYGLCSRGVEEVTTRRCRLVVPRAHDCITLLLGDRQRYDQYVREHPGTYWYSPGWNRCHEPPGPRRLERAIARYREKFDEETVQYLVETEQSWLKHYSRATWVDLGAGVREEDVNYTRQCATDLGWAFDRVAGSPDLMLALLNGQWDDERFLVLQPGQSATMTADESVIKAVGLPNGTSVKYA